MMRTRWHSMVQVLTIAGLATGSTPLLANESLPLLLADTEHGQADVPLYLVSEKLDGVRAFWDGQTLRTRSGNSINAPAWFIKDFPAQALDGELWIGRGHFDLLSGTVRRQVPNDAEWRQVRYLVFELPQAPGSFRERAESLRKIVRDANVPWLEALEQFELGSRQALERKLKSITRAGGEGLMLHRADAPYLTGRSEALLKMKLWHDAEATVIGHEPGKGKHAGRLGALRVRTADGIEFRLGTGLSDAERDNPPPVGSSITYRYRDLTPRGLPRFASYHRVRDF